MTQETSHKTAKPSAACSNGSGIAQPRDRQHEIDLVARYSRILTRREVNDFRNRRLNMCDESNTRYHCIAVGSLLLTCEHLLELCKQNGIEVT